MSGETISIQQKMKKNRIMEKLNEKSKGTLIAFIIVFIIAATISVFFIYSSIREYYKYEVISKIRLFNEISMLFPTVTICNLNRNNLDAKSLFVLNSSSFNQLKPNGQSFTFYNLTLNDILINCKYIVRNDCRRDWIPYFDYNYGSCYRFNSGYDANGNSVPIKTIQKAGGLMGLYLELFIGKVQFEEYPYSGFKVLINNNTVLPSYYEGLNVQPGTLTKISIKKVFTKRLPKPYSDCQDLNKFSSKLYEIFLHSNLTYRQEDCHDLCIQTIILEKCNCFVLKYLMLSQKTYKPCVNLKQFKCVSTILENLNETTKNCSSMCPLECDSLSYESTISTVSFPSRIYLKRLIKRKLHKYFKTAEELSYENVREYVLALDINFDELKYTVITESPYKTFAFLLSEIGGTCSIFLGLSLLSFIRVLEFFSDVILRTIIIKKNK